jgi:hypothetical protein
MLNGICVYGQSMDGEVALVFVLSRKNSAER